MVRKTLSVTIVLPDGGSDESVKVARDVIRWLEDPANQPYESFVKVGTDSNHFVVKDRVWSWSCCGMSREVRMDAVFEHDPKAPRLQLVCTSPQFRYFSSSWQVLESESNSETSKGVVLEVRGDLVVEPKPWSVTSALALRHALQYQEVLLTRLKREMERRVSERHLAAVPEDDGSVAG